MHWMGHRAANVHYVLCGYINARNDLKVPELLKLRGKGTLESSAAGSFRNFLFIEIFCDLQRWNFNDKY